MAILIASGERLLQAILYSGSPPNASETACLESEYASSTDLPRTMSVAIDEQAMATGQPTHLKRISAIRLFSILSVTNTVSLSNGLLSMALPDGFSKVPTFLGCK